MQLAVLLYVVLFKFEMTWLYGWMSWKSSNIIVAVAVILSILWYMTLKITNLM